MENKKTSQQKKNFSALGPFLSLFVPVLYRVTSFSSRLKQITFYLKKLTCLLTHRITRPTVACITCPTTTCEGTIIVVAVSHSVTVVSICFTFIYVWLWKVKVIFIFLLCLIRDQSMNHSRMMETCAWNILYLSQLYECKNISGFRSPSNAFLQGASHNSWPFWFSSLLAFSRPKLVQI